MSALCHKQTFEVPSDDTTRSRPPSPIVAKPTESQHIGIANPLSIGQGCPYFYQKLKIEKFYSRARTFTCNSCGSVRFRIVRTGRAGETDVGWSAISADGATAPETLRHQDRATGRSGERRLIASTEGDIRAARLGLSSQVPQQMGINCSASAGLVHV